MLARAMMSAFQMAAFFQSDPRETPTKQWPAPKGGRNPPYNSPLWKEMMPGLYEDALPREKSFWQTVLSFL